MGLHSEPGRDWTSEEIIVELRSSEGVVRKGMADLLTAGLILAEEDGHVRYGPASPQLDLFIGRLAEAYRTKPGAVRRVIIQQPSGKLRSFSDAFRILKDRDP